MKTSQKVCASAALVIIAISGSRAADGTWTNLAGGSWADSANWAGSTLASGTGFTADFSTLDLAAPSTVTLDGSRTIGNLLFADAANPDSDWTLGTGSGGPLTLAVSSGSPTITVSNRTATVSAVLAGSSGLTKAGAGALVLSGINTYGGGTTISAGQLVIGHFQALVYGTGTVNAGATLDLHGYCAIASPRWCGFFSTLNIGGMGSDGNGALLNSTGVVGNVAAGGYTWLSGTGNQYPAINLTADTLFNLTTDFAQLNGGYATTYLNLNGYALTKSGIGSYYLCNTTLGNGNLTIANGTIVLNRASGSSGSRFQGTGTVTIGDGAGNGVLSLDNYQTNGLITRPITLNGGKITAAGASQIDSPITLNATNAANVFDTPASLTLAGVLDGSGGLTKTNASTLTLINTNTYSGDTRISAGTLTIGGAGQLGGGNYPSNIINGGTFIYASSSDQTLSGCISGAGALLKTNSSLLMLSGSNTFSGGTTINAGKIVMNSFRALNRGAWMRVGVGGALDMHGYGAYGTPLWTGAFNAMNVGGAGPDGKGALLNSTGIIDNVAAGGYIWNNNHAQHSLINLTADTLFNLDSDFGQLGALHTNTYLNLNGYTLTKSGVGNYYLCNTTVSNGNLVILGGALVLQKSNAVTGSRIQGTGTVTVGDGSGNGTLVLDAGQTAGSITRPILLNGGRITVTGAAQIDSPVALNATNAANTVDTPFTLTLAGALGGAGGLTKTGAGTLVLTNANTYAGDTTVSTGTLALATAGNVTLSDDATVRVAAGGKLKLNAGVNERVKYLYLNGERMWVGTWGSTSSSASHKNDIYFEAGSSGVLTVTSGPGGTLIQLL